MAIIIQNIDKNLRETTVISNHITNTRYGAR